MKRESTWSGTTSETLVAAALVAAMLTAFAAVAADIAWGMRAAGETAGVALFLAALIVGPIYAQTLRTKDRPVEDAAWRR